jgi:hypothetical protein
MKTILRHLILSLLSVIATSAAYADSVQALQSDSFVDSIGVAVKFENNPELGNWSTIEPSLTGLGVRHIRAGIYGPNNASLEYLNANIAELYANHGIKTTMVSTETTNNLLDVNKISPDLSYIQNTTYSQYNNTSLLSATDAIEGPNEWDHSGDPNWATDVNSYQTSLYNAVRGNSAFASIPVIAPSMATSENLNKLPNMSSIVQYGNGHPYPGNLWPGYNEIDTVLCYAQLTWPSAPQYLTEDGYSTMSGNTTNCVPEATEGILEPRLLLENFRRGVKRTFLYNLIDDELSSDTGNYRYHYGLLHYDGTFSQKPAYPVIKNLISILADPGSSFAPGALSFNIGNQSGYTGQTADVHSLLLEKRNGQYYLALWVETGTTTDTRNVVVTFDDAMGPTSTYNPAQGTSPTAVTLTSNSVSLTLTSTPTIIHTYPNFPNGSLLVDDLADLSMTSSNLNWTTLAASPTTWLGRTTEAERTQANANNYVIYSSVDIRGFTALVGFGFNTTVPDGVTYAFSKLVCSASPDGTSWTTVPMTTSPGEIDKTAAFDAQSTATWLISVSPTGALPTGTNYIKFSVDSSDGVGLPQLFQMNVRQSGVVEAESMTQTVSGATSATEFTSNASGGEYVQFNATATGQYIQFTTPVLPPGTYSFWYRYMRGTNYGICQPAIDGTNIGGATGQNGTAGQFAEAERGTVSFSTAQTHTIRFTVTGTATSGYTVDCDRVVFQAQ